MKQPVVDDVVFQLRQALERAEAGEIVTVALVSATAGGEGFSAYATNDLVGTIGQLAILQHQLATINAKQTGKA